MDRHWNTAITRSKVWKSVKSYHPIATTWSISPSSKRRSDPPQWHHRRMQEEEVRRCFAMVTWRLDVKKRFQCCVNPNSSNQFLYVRAIQGHSKGSAIDPALDDNILLPKEFTEYLYHAGNANELNSTTRNELIPGGTRLKRGRQAVFFTTVNPMEDVYGMGETPCDLTKPRIAPCKNTWKHFQNSVFWCNLKLAQERGCNFY